MFCILPSAAGGRVNGKGFLNGGGQYIGGGSGPG